MPQLTVRAEDNRGRSNLASVRVIIVRVTDSPPQFLDTPYRTTVDVNRAINSTVYRVRAVDPDGLVSSSGRCDPLSFLVITIGCRLTSGLITILMPPVMLGRLMHLRKRLLQNKFTRQGPTLQARLIF